MITFASRAQLVELFGGKAVEVDNVEVGVSNCTDRSIVVNVGVGRPMLKDPSPTGNIVDACRRRNRQ
jgi:hypothetical protein